MFRGSVRALVLAIGETCLLVVAIGLAAHLRLGNEAWSPLTSFEGQLRLLLIVFVCQVCLHYADLYDLRVVGDPRELLVRLFQALGATSLLLAFIYFWAPDWMIGRGVFLVACGVVLSFSTGWRFA